MVTYGNDWGEREREEEEKEGWWFVQVSKPGSQSSRMRNRVPGYEYKFAYFRPASFDVPRGNPPTCD